MAQAAALRARLLLARGDLEAATAWAAKSGLDPLDPQVDRPGMREVEYITLARVLAAGGRRPEALDLLERLLRPAQVEDRRGAAIEILALQAVIFQAAGDARSAQARLERALLLAEPEGFVRSFLDEGEPMRRLLLDCRAGLRKQPGAGAGEALRLLGYTARLLAAFPPPADAPLPGAGPEPLSERELDVLRLIADGRANREIADTLVIAVSTVKTHVNNLYGKLGAGRRTEAVAIARSLGLLDDQPAHPGRE
jgi:LuxR family maltose regulon positive regulatory protein